MSSDPATLIDGFASARAALLRAAAEVPPERRMEPFVGHWNLMDLLAHVIGWDYTNVRAIEEFRAGTLPEFYKHYEPSWETYNAALVEAFGSSDWDELVKQLALSQSAFLGALGTVAPGEWADSGVTWRERPVSIAGIVRAAIRDEQEHTEQVRRFVESLRRAGG